MSRYRLLARNTAAIFAGRLAAIALGVALATVLFRGLGAERYGIWSLLTLITGYSTLIDFGLSSAVERRVATLTAAGDGGRVPATIVTTLALIAAACMAAQVLIVVSLLLATLFATYAFIESYRWLLALVCVHGVVWSALLTSSGAYMAGSIPPERRAE